jgi:CheY-like chemotaxis protein
MCDHRKRWVLVVDDDRSVRDLLETILRPRYNVVVANTGVEALNVLRERPTDAVVLDLRMPDMDGRMFLTECRSQPRLATLPVLVVSAEPSAHEDSQRLGVQACLPKPFDVDSLLGAVEQLLEPHPGS